MSAEDSSVSFHPSHWLFMKREVLGKWGKTSRDAITGFDCPGSVNGIIDCCRKQDANLVDCWRRPPASTEPLLTNLRF